METVERPAMHADVASRAGEYYGVEVPHEAVWAAWENANGGVVLFQAVHDGSLQSLGVVIDRQEAEVSVYAGEPEPQLVR